MAEPVTFEGANPILRVEDMATSLSFYVDLLGFKAEEWGDADFTMVTRDRAGIYLCRGDQGRGAAWIWVGISDADQLHADLVMRGVAIRMAPVTYPWAREFHVEDPDGNVIRFGSDPD
jgi:catechol 2,3-dioxygenase-like lactoylglutathione lyase family enzyme